MFEKKNENMQTIEIIFNKFVLEKQINYVLTQSKKIYFTLCLWAIHSLEYLKWILIKNDLVKPTGGWNWVKIKSSSQSSVNYHRRWRPKLIVENAILNLFESVSGAKIAINLIWIQNP